MYDRELVTDILQSVLWSVDQIRKRTLYIVLSDDFVKDDAGREKLDAVCMQ